LNRLFTEQFFEEVKRVLRPNGVFVLSLTVSPDAQIEMIQRTLCIISTLKKVFKNVRCTPAHLTIASDSPLETDPAVLAERYINRSVKSDYFDPALYATLFQPSEQERIDSALERFSKETEVSINTDENPNAVVKSLKLWRLLSTDEDRVFYDAIESIKLEHIAVIAGVLFALGSVLRIFRRDITFSYSVYLTVFACGFFGMAVSITLLVLLQSTVGIAYSLVSALSGVFMFGLAAGAEITLKHNFNSKRVLIILILISIALTFSLLSILPLSSLIRSRTFSAVLFMILSLLSGAIVGAVYRVALALCKDMPKSAARIYSVDLFGATFGSISIGCAILLTSGILISTVSVSLVLFSALLCLLTAPHRP
jgi:spermidine synthase